MGSHQVPPNTPILAVFAFHSDKLNRDFKAETKEAAGSMPAAEERSQYKG